MLFGKNENIIFAELYYIIRNIINLQQRIYKYIKNLTKISKKHYQYLFKNNLFIYKYSTLKTFLKNR